MLSDEQLLRYSRQLVLPELDLVGQERLLGARILVVGAGGIGSPLLWYLAASGVGHITLIDHDVVEAHNLPRQVLFDAQDIGLLKSQVAARKLTNHYPDTSVEAICAELRHVDELPATHFDLLVDATDTPSAGRILNEAALQRGVPLLYLAGIAMEGRLFVAQGYERDKACLECYLGTGSDSRAGCTTLGVLAPSVGALALLGATQVIRLLLGESLDGLFCIDTWRFNTLRLEVRKDANCTACGFVAKE